MQTTDDKITTTCPIPGCNTTMHIPSSKHIMATCPSCKAKIEYKNGQLVSYSGKGHNFRRMAGPKQGAAWLTWDVKAMAIAATITFLFAVGSIIANNNRDNSRDTIAYATTDTAIPYPEPQPVPAQATPAYATATDTSAPVYKPTVYSYTADTAQSGGSSAYDKLQNAMDVLDAGKDITEILMEINGEEIPWEAAHTNPYDNYGRQNSWYWQYEQPGRGSSPRELRKWIYGDCGCPK